jgi:hypothetical protein
MKETIISYLLSSLNFEKMTLLLRLGMKKFDHSISAFYD